MPNSESDSDEILKTMSNEFKRKQQKREIVAKKEPIENKKISAPIQNTRVYRKIKVLLKENEKYKTILVDENKNLVDSFKLEDLEDVKIMYKNILVSKYMTFAGLKAQNEDEFEIVKTVEKEPVKAVEIKTGFKIKILFEPGNFFMLENIDEKLNVKNLLKLCKEKCTLKRSILLMNGTVLKDDQILEDFLEDEELLDFV